MFSDCLTPHADQSCDSVRGQTKLTEVDDCTEFDADRLSGCQGRAPKTPLLG